MQPVTAYVRFIYSDHEYTATVRSDSPESIIGYIERETRPFGLGFITVDVDTTQPGNMLIVGEIRRWIYDAIEVSKAYDETLDLYVEE